MKSIRSIYSLIAIVVFTLTVSSLAHAQTRTWVSGVGDDVNPCSRTAPCKTFAGAISHTSAGGEINAIDSGGFGTVTITKSITIDGQGVMASILAAGTNAVNINDSASATPNASVVAIRNISMNGATTGLVGVNITAAKNVLVENCTIQGFRSGNGNGIRDGRTAVTSPAGQLWVNNTNIWNTSGSGIIMVGAAGAGIRGFFQGVTVFGGSSHGIQIQNASVAHIRNSNLSGVLGDGVRVETSAKVNIISSMMNGNLNGVNNVAGTVNLADVSILNNAGAGVSGTVVSFGNNNVRDNASGNTLPAAVGQQ